jgi:hypothetical protein
MIAGMSIHQLEAKLYSADTIAVIANPIRMTFFAPNRSAIHPLGTEIRELAIEPALSNDPNSIGFAPNEVA